MVMKDPRTRGSEDYNFWPVYSDLALSMILILMLFLLSMFILNSRLLIVEDLARQRVEQLQILVRSELEGTEGIREIVENGNLQEINLSADFLFRSDQAVLLSEGRRLLNQMCEVFLGTQSNFTRLAVEGHADFQHSFQFFREYSDLASDHGNWRLSAERAVEVVQLLQGCGIPGRKLEVAGRSFYQPVDTAFQHLNPDNPGEEERFYSSLRQNRRILIRIFYSEIETE